MYYILGAIFGLIAFAMAVLFAVQFWRLGQYLKQRWPVAFRLYASVWFFIGGVLSIVLSAKMFDYANPAKPSYDYAAIEANRAANQAALAATDAALAAQDAQNY